MLLKCFGSFPFNFQPTNTCPNHYVSNYMNMSNEFKVKSKKYFEHIQQINILFSLLTLNRSLLTETCITNKCLQGTIILWENLLLKKDRYDKIKSTSFLKTNLMINIKRLLLMQIGNKWTHFSLLLHSISKLETVHIETRNLNQPCKSNDWFKWLVSIWTWTVKWLVPAFGWACTIMGRYLRQNKLYAFF